MDIDGGLLRAGHAYILVVNEGELRLNANAVVLTSRPADGVRVSLWNNIVDSDDYYARTPT